jgi:peptidoglycan/xylan/chitin deacetylase (PgdA/CDA1 family)
VRLGRKTIDLEDRGAAVMRVLDLFKSPANSDPADFIATLEASCELTRPTRDATLFLSWEDARRLHAAGMQIGAHTHSHPILAKLPAPDQCRELERSKAVLESSLGTTIDLLAYPVGARDAFTEETKHIARACGYRAAFSCYGGENVPRKTDAFDIRRVPIYWGARAEWLLAQTHASR